MAIYGYIKQNYPLPTNDQLKVVTDYKCREIFIEQARDTTSEQQRLLSLLKPGDTVIITSLQVFGKTTEEIAVVLSCLKTKRVQLISWSTQLHLNYYKRVGGLFIN